MEAGAAGNQSGFDQQSTFIAGYKRQQRAANQHQIEHANCFMHSTSRAQTVQQPATVDKQFGHDQHSHWLLQFKSSTRQTSQAQVGTELVQSAAVLPTKVIAAETAGPLQSGQQEIDEPRKVLRRGLGHRTL